VKFEVILTDEARYQLDALGDPNSGVGKQVRKTLGLLETNMRHPSLQTHPFHSKTGPNGEKVFEAYAQQHTPGARRVFFYYGPDGMEGGKRIPRLTIVSILKHP